MFEGLFKVKYVNFKTSFVYLSPAHLQIHTGSYIKLSYEEDLSKETKAAFFSVAVVNSLELEDIGINSVYAKSLNLPENSYIHVSSIEHLPVVNSISITPKDQNDYEVLDAFSQGIQENLLNQVRVVNRNYSLVIWIGNSISVTVYISEVRPMSPGVLDFLTEVHIKYPNDVADTLSGKKPRPKNIPFFESERKYLDYIMANPQKTIAANIVDFLHAEDGDVFRTIPIFPDSILDIQKIFRQHGDNTTVFAYCEKSDIFLLTVLNSTHSLQRVYIKMENVDDYVREGYHRLKGKINKQDLMVTSKFLTALDLDFGCRVGLKKIKDPNPLVFEIQIHARRKLYNNIDRFKEYLTERLKYEWVLLNADWPYHIGEDLCVSLKFLPESSYCVIDEDIFKNVKYSLVEDKSVTPLEPKNLDKYCVFDLKCNNIFRDISKTVSQNTIIAGKIGTGKTTCLRWIYSSHTVFLHFYNEIVYGKQLKGKSIEALQKVFSDVAHRLVSRQPSILLLDDLHVLCESVEDESPNAVYFNRVSEMLYNLLQLLTKKHKIFIVATVESRFKLNKHIYNSRGTHLFNKVVDIPPLSKDNRIQVLEYYFRKRSHSLNYEELATKTEGYVLQDIGDFYIKSVYEAHKQEQNFQKIPKVTSELCDIALQKITPLSLQNVKFSDVRYKSFSDIGGLKEIKNVLIESLLWPAQFSKIFSGCPLRLQSGILLYGAPGTGKTLLAGAAAKYCDLRLISVKGPELLSKYIGASEQAVRDIFEKAQNAKPCILFFDEFDSLAPRRGHDNTGVTDRVVNQLLTHLDGIEELSDVFVMAATSRPDLLDPALLRPGRLDKQLLCPLPNEEERLEILDVLSKGLDFGECVQLQKVAKMTENFTGADLQSVMYTAQMSLVTDIESEDDPTERDLRIMQMKKWFAPNTPKHFLPERAKKSLLEQITGDTVQEDALINDGLVIIVTLENKEMRVINSTILMPLDIRDFFLEISFNFEIKPDTPVAIYDFNNWQTHQPHYAVFVGNCKPNLNIEKIDHQCLMDAVSRTRCSLTEGERQKYNNIYKRFQGGQIGENFRPGSKITLA